MSTHTKQQYLNRVQMLVQMVQAEETYCVVSRGVGKSTGIAPAWFLHRVKLMPGGASFICGSTYKQILSRTLPPFISTLQQMGYADGFDFVVNRKPPDFWDAKPIVPPQRYEDTIAWSNGHVTYLVSQDRPGSPNSLSLQFGMADEARFLDMERFNTDLMPAMRGNRELFGHLPEYLSLLFMTDQPTTAEGRWILDKEASMKPELIRAIVTLAGQINELKREILRDKSTGAVQRFTKQLTTVQNAYDQLRKGAVLFVEGDVFDNIHVLGAGYVQKMKAMLPDRVFRVSILNERMTKTENSFYPDLDDVRHCYREEYNYEYLKTVNLSGGQVPDWRQDKDLRTDMPLHLGPDHGASYNGFAIGQGNQRWLRVVNYMYVLNPQTTEDLVEDFCKYYKGYPANKVIYYYDHTMKAESGKARNITYVDEVRKVFKKHGWMFDAVYIGATPNPTDRFLLASKCFRGQDEATHVTFNREKTEVLRMAMHDTKAVTGTKENSLKKDKRAERDTKVSQDKTTHGPDAFDMLLHGVSNPERFKEEQLWVIPAKQ
jgi:hypothetical protein